MSDKTEEPTPQRLKKAREEGDSPVSGALMQAAGFIVAIALVPAAVAGAASRAADLIRAAVAHPHDPLSAPDLAREVVVLVAPLVVAAAVAAAVVGFVQSGGMVATKKLAPDLSRANPITGIKNLFNWQRAVGVLRSLLAALIVGWLAVRLLIDHAGDLVHTIGNPLAIAVVAGTLAKKLVWIAALVGLALGLVDLLVTRYGWLKRNRMTKDEVKREYKESEGDPEIKQARERAHQEMLRGATVAAVKNATVVIVNPTHLATALRYSEDGDDDNDDADAAPRVIAQGEGDLAKRMIEAANAYGVPVVRDVPVARALSELEIGDEIPEALYEAVAEILRDVWEQASGETADEDGGRPGAEPGRDD